MPRKLFLYLLPSYFHICSLFHDCHQHSPLLKSLHLLYIFPHYVVFFLCLLERVSVILFFHCQRVSSFLSSLVLFIYAETYFKWTNALKIIKNCKLFLFNIKNQVTYNNFQSKTPLPHEEWGLQYFNLPRFAYTVFCKLLLAKEAKYAPFLVISIKH